MSVNLEELSEHDRLVMAIVNILSAYGFQVQYTIKGKRTTGVRVVGDSGVNYYPDVIAEKGPLKVVCDIRTRGQRGTSDDVDRGAVQFLQAELDDLTKALNRPHGMMITPHGIQKDAKMIARQFGILVGILPMHIVEKILSLDVISEKEGILEIAREFGIIFS